MRFHQYLIALLLCVNSINVMAAFEMRLPIGATPAVYTFDAGPWTTCSVFTSTQQRTGNCLLNGSSTVSDGFCSEVNTGRDQSCTPSYTYAYSYGSYGTCSLTTATQQRSSVCLRDHDSAISDNSLCSGTPSLSRSCTPNYTYSVTYGSYGACSASTSTQSRSATCRRDHDGLVSSNALCGSLSLTRACNPYTYAWSVGGYGSCTGHSTGCVSYKKIKHIRICKAYGPIAGTGRQSRSVLCRRSPGGASVSTGYCTASKPSTSRGC